jgi:hypothetical protein
MFGAGAGRRQNGDDVLERLPRLVGKIVTLRQP